jgi:hypothetical protein
MPPAASISFFVASSSSAPRAQMTTFAPAPAIFSAAALPMPDEPPVMTTTRPLTLPVSERSTKRSGSR